VLLFGGSLARLNTDRQFHDDSTLNLLDVCGKSPFYAPELADELRIQSKNRVRMVAIAGSIRGPYHDTKVPSIK
jgi:hypothetical protein